VTKANPAWYRIFNSSPSGLGRPILESARVPQIFDIINEAVTKKSAQELEFGIGERTFVARAVPFEIGGEQGCVTVISDVSKLKQMETMRRDFTANVSHQMKTPLTSILGYSETLLRMNEDDRASVKAFARTIHDQGTKLKELIDDILELARIESPRHGPDVTSVELKDVVDVVAREFQKNDKGITFALNVPNTVIMSDAKDVRHIFHNLMDNAVKFSPRGAVVEVLGRANGKTVEVSVRDFGPGIPEDELGRIFERFYRVPSAGSISPEGSGLGLAIAKHLTERLGGAIKAESVEGSGSTFTVTLPG
jgi:two-component system phosphate regulon sensor histidine kinase PhoR